MLTSVVAVSLALCVLTANPAVLDVPGGYPTVQAAIEAAQPGDTVYIHAGTYDEGLVLKSGVTLEGEDKGSVTVRRPAADGPVLSISNCTDVFVRGISFEHLDRPAEDDYETKPSPIVEITDSAVEVYACEVRNSGGSGIRIGGKSTCKVLACSVLNSLRLGILARGPDVMGWFVGNTCTGNTCGISFQEDARGAAKINRCVENNSFGIEVVGKGKALIFRNTCSKNGGCGIIAREDSLLPAHGNRCEENGASGIAIHAGAGAELLNNVLENNAWNGIWYASNCATFNKGNTYTFNHEFSRDEAYHLFQDRQFAQLEEIAARLRRDKTKSYDGEWELPNLYDGVTYNCDNMSKDEEREFLDRLQEWKKAYPTSITCATVEAGAYCDLAWRERGSGWASEVTPEGWDGFHAYLDKALEAAEAAEKLPERDPHLYQVKAGILLGMDETSASTPPILTVLGWWTNTDLSIHSPAEQAFLQGVALEPTYYPLYYARTRPLMPRWGGSASEMVKFAEWSAQATSKSEGESLYARIAAQTLRSEGQEDYLKDYRFSWPRIRQGYRDLLQRYPESYWRLNQFCFLACLHGDRETAKELFEQLGDSWNGNVWDNEEHFNRWKEWATKGAKDPSADPLVRAVREGNVPELERLLRAGGNPNALAEDGSSLLVVAIYDAQVGIVETLLANGADVNFVPAEGTAPINAAVGCEKDDSLLRLLLAHKANVNVTPKDGWSPLLFSVGRGMTDRVRLLLDHGANPNDSVNGQCALIHAVYRGELELVRTLVGKGADVNLRDMVGNSALKIAEDNKKTEIAAFLREHGATR